MFVKVLILLVVVPRNMDSIKGLYKSGVPKLPTAFRYVCHVKVGFYFTDSDWQYAVLVELS